MIALLAGTDTFAGRLLSKGLVNNGWRVFQAGADGQSVDFQQIETLETLRERVLQETDHIDLLVTHIDYKPSDLSLTITNGLDYGEIQKAYDINTLGVLRVVSTFYDLLKNGDMKRIGVVGSVEGSNYTSRQKDNYAYAMSMSALHMQLSILFNRLRPEGFTFRLYGADGHDAEYGDYLLDYFTRGRSFELGDPRHSDENRLVMRDGLGRDIPW